MLVLEAHGLSGPICIIFCQRDWVGSDLKDGIENATQGALLACDLQLALGGRHIGDRDLLPEDVNSGMILTVIQVPLPEWPSLGQEVYRAAIKRRYRGFDVVGFERDLAKERGLKRIGTETTMLEQWSEQDTLRYQFWTLVKVERDLAEERGLERIGTDETELPEHWSEQDTLRYRFWTLAGVSKTTGP